MAAKQAQEKHPIAKLMAQALDPNVVETGQTKPAYGVYRVDSDQVAGSYRFGAYPARQTDLERQFHKVELVVLFSDGETAKMISAYLNGAW
jgi:hypothetical protein